MDVSPDERDDLASYVLDALDTDELKAFDARLDDCAHQFATWREALADLSHSVSTEPPADLLVGVLAGARGRRSPGGSLLDVPDLSAPDAFVTTIEQLDALLTDLRPADWSAPTIEGWRVQDLVAHLVAVESYFGRQLGLWPFDFDPALEADHLGMTRRFVAAWSSRPYGDVLTAWRARSSAVVAHVASLDRDALRQPCRLHYLDTTLSTVLVARVFEVWTHDEDIRRATGRHIERPDAARLRRMSRVAVPSMPFGLAVGNLTSPGRTARIVLTGPGGGTWDQPLSPGEVAGPPDTTLVLDVVDYCRLAAMRLRADEVAVTVEGDAELAQRVLAGAGVFSA